MAGINDYSNTAGSNTTINGIDISEGCSPAGINNAIRQLMADIADMDDGVVPLQTPDINGGTIDGAAIGGSSTIDSSIIGGTTPAAGTFTTLTANTSATISGDLTVDTDTLYVDSSNNRVGVGTTTPAEALVVKGDGKRLTVESDDYDVALIGGASSSGAGLDRGYIRLRKDGVTADGIVLNTDGNSWINGGNLLVGKTSGPNFNTVGIDLTPLGEGQFTGDGRDVLTLTRKTSNGDIATFRKDTTTVGRIGTWDGAGVYIGSPSATDAYLYFGNSYVAPSSTTGFRDNAIDLGNGSARFDDIYATNGTIQTSDQNEKQSIQSLTASEMAVAQRISKLFKTFKFNSAVEEKGDNARTHTGVIAQDIQQAFTDEGLDAGNYALFISSTWWEKEISVDAVAPQEAVYETQTDEEGNEIQVLVQEAVEGKDAYTYIDTKEEATEGYTQRTRLGIRYPELLSFVSSAFEQRLTDIETRLTALEA